MRQNRRQATGLAVSLFPFLAVLICTMGMLIVMLVIAVKSSSVKAQQAKQEQTEDVQQKRDHLVDQLDLEQFRVDEITKLRPGLQERLEQEKLRRSHLDNEIRKLVRKAEQLSARYRQLVDDDSLAQSADRDDSREIESLTQQILDRRQNLTQLKSEVAGRPLMYSIVPTRSSGGTTRRPIYVECTPAGIELHPSGIKLGLSDFTKPITPGNPLDAALLATREYWNKFEAGSSEGEPYPLIVVRPGGATAYAIARRAMSSWDDEFGYELVEAEKQLNWGQSDPNLRQTLEDAIRIAMIRQNQKVAVGRARWMDGTAEVRSGIDGSDAATSSGRTGSEANGNRGSGPSSERFGQSPQYSAADGTGQGFGERRSVVGGQRAGEFQETNGGSATGSNGFDVTKDDSLSRFASEDRKARGLIDSPYNPLRPGMPADNQTLLSSQANEAPGSTTSNGDPSVLSSGDGGSGNVNGSASNTNGSGQSLSEQRGANWALPTRTPGATPYRRPIRVECNDTHYLVHSGDPALEPVRVEIASEVDVSIDNLVHQIWNQIEGWGIAEIGGFWKPVLRLSSESRDGAVRADELARKLKGSGIEIERFWR